jgi:hypothetical protein
MCRRASTIAFAHFHSAKQFISSGDPHPSHYFCHQISSDFFLSNFSAPRDAIGKRRISRLNLASISCSFLFFRSEHFVDMKTHMPMSGLFGLASIKA